MFVWYDSIIIRICNLKQVFKSLISNPKRGLCISLSLLYVSAPWEWAPPPPPLSFFSLDARFSLHSEFFVLCCCLFFFFFFLSLFGVGFVGIKHLLGWGEVIQWRLLYRQLLSKGCHCCGCCSLFCQWHLTCLSDQPW